jgi:hypothetical protein
VQESDRTPFDGVSVSVCCWFGRLQASTKEGGATTPRQGGWWSADDANRYSAL